eukprot:353273-Chlamydomonas_euryale.AAC.22
MRHENVAPVPARPYPPMPQPATHTWNKRLQRATSERSADGAARATLADLGPRSTTHHAQCCTGRRSFVAHVNSKAGRRRARSAVFSPMHVRPCGVNTAGDRSTMTERCVSLVR